MLTSTGETIQVTVTFNQPVKVHESHDGVVEPDELENVASLGLEIGNHYGSADYTSGSGTNTLVFEFLLNSEDYVDYDGVSVPAEFSKPGPLDTQDPRHYHVRLVRHVIQRPAWRHKRLVRAQGSRPAERQYTTLALSPPLSPATPTAPARASR